MRRTLDHTTRYRCKDVQTSFQKHRAELVARALSLGAKVISDDGTHFYAEAFNCSRQRLTFHAGEVGMPFANGPSVTHTEGAVQYSSLFLPKQT